MNSSLRVSERVGVVSLLALAAGITVPALGQMNAALAPHPDTTSITVTFDPQAAPAEHRASGFLALINSTTPDPPTEYVRPLKPRLWKNAYNTNFERIVTDFDCPTVLTTLSEHWGLPDRSPPPWLDDDHPEWTTWESFCRQHVFTHLDQGFNPVWNIWNEPDGGNRWWHGPEGWTNLARTYEHAFASIRQAYVDHPSFDFDDMVVAAPGFADWGNAYGFHAGINYWTHEPFEEGFAGFLEYCGVNSLECHVIMWHEFWEDYIFYIPTKAAILRSLVEDAMRVYPDLNVQRYYVDEMIHASYPYDFDYHLSPGHVATVLGLIEESGVDGAVRACWQDRHGFSGNINHSVDSVLDVKYCEDPPGNPVLWPPPSYCHAEPYSPRSQYWVHWYYADFSGPVARVEASYPVQGGFGTYDHEREVYQALLGYSLAYGVNNGVPTYGYGTTRTVVHFEGLPDYGPTRIAFAQLAIIEIAPSGLEALPGPLVPMREQRVIIEDGSFSCTIPAMKRGHAYVLQVSMVGSAPGGP